MGGGFWGSWNRKTSSGKVWWTHLSVLLVRCLWGTQLLMTSKHLKTWSGVQKRGLSWRYKFQICSHRWQLKPCEYMRLPKENVYRVSRKDYRTELWDTRLPKGQKMERCKKKSLRKSRLSHREQTRTGPHGKQRLEEKIDPKCWILLKGQLR